MILVVPPDASAIPGALLESFAAKDLVDRAEAVLRRLEEELIECAKQMASWQRRKAIVAARAERVTQAVLERMREYGTERVDGWQTRFEARTAPPSVEIVDEALLPEAFVRAKEVKTPDKHAIREAIGREMDVPGARLFHRVTLQRREL